MTAKIVFLGTGTGNYNSSKQLRGTGGIIVKNDEFQIHIDPGPASTLRAKEQRINLRENIAILISHAHLNHCNDLNTVISAMTYSGMDTRGVLLAPKSVIEGDDKTGNILHPFYKNSLERCIIVEKNKKIGIEDLDIDVTPCSHSVEAVGYKLSFSNFTLTYTGDTSYSHKLIDAYKDTDVLILNLGGVEPVEFNLNVSDAIKIAKEVKPGLLIITHFNYDNMKERPIEIARYIQKESRIQTIAAKDGLEVNPLYYAKTSRQKKLKY